MKDNVDLESRVTKIDTRAPLKKKREKSGSDQSIYDTAAESALKAGEWILKQQKQDGHWCAELESNATITSEYVYMCQALGLDVSDRKDAMIRYFKGNQKSDGSWGIAFNHPGDVSTTVEVYFALRILGLPVNDSCLEAAQKFIRDNGGIEKVRIFTRINLACFGLFPWESIPVIPPEFIFLPPQSPVNIYSLSSWARSTMVPLFIIFHHKPIFALPNGKSETNDWLDHLWLDPSKKNIPYCDAWFEILRKEGLGYRSFFTAADRVLRAVESLREHPRTKVARQFVQRATKNAPILRNLAETSVRELAVERCEQWVLERQEESGDWAGIFPPMVNGVIALYLNGYTLHDDCIRKGLEAIDRFAINDELGYRVQACVSPVWDTVLSMIGLLDCGFSGSTDRMLQARSWVANEQILVNYGDWKVYNPTGRSGGWAFEYKNTWYPDVDDTAAVVIALLKQDPKSGTSDTVVRAVEWMVSMQNKDGGWAAFDRGNNKTFLNQIPFSDMDSLCEPSSPDVTGRVLEALGLLNNPQYKDVCARGIDYIRQTQEVEGSWFGRWGVNYIYGTSNVLCSLVRQGVSDSDPMIQKALNWIESKQNRDGGWGECLESYKDKSLMGEGPSTASQTAWALMALLAYRPSSDEAIVRGIQWLADKQIKSGKDLGTWEEQEFTGTGFPNHFYLRYHLYRHFFPMMAIGRFLKRISN